MLPGFHTSATSLNANELDFGSICEGIENTNGVAATADTGQDRIGESAFLFNDLLAGFTSDNRLEIAYNTWIGVWSCRCSKKIESCLDICDPVTNGFIDGIF